LEVVNIGAAGTFIVPVRIAPAKLRARIREALSFTPEIMIFPARAILELIESAPFNPHDLVDGARPCVTIMSSVPAGSPKLPLHAPSRADWEVKVQRVSGCAALSLWRPRGKHILYPNAVIEKAFGIQGTTRSWSTIEKIGRILASVSGK
jgi:uncharacterized protein (DUF1697 family)